jgi:hypothetical protein
MELHTDIEIANVTYKALWHTHVSPDPITPWETGPGIKVIQVDAVTAIASGDWVVLCAHFKSPSDAPGDHEHYQCLLTSRQSSDFMRDQDEQEVLPHRFIHRYMEIVCEEDVAELVVEAARHVCDKHCPRPALPETTWPPA